MKCLVQVRRTEVFEVEVVALNTFDCQTYALSGANASHRTPTDVSEEAVVLTVLER